MRRFENASIGTGAKLVRYEIPVHDEFFFRQLIFEADCFLCFCHRSSLNIFLRNKIHIPSTPVTSVPLYFFRFSLFGKNRPLFSILAPFSLNRIGVVSGDDDLQNIYIFKIESQGPFKLYLIDSLKTINYRLRRDNERKNHRIINEVDKFVGVEDSFISNLKFTLFGILTKSLIRCYICWRKILFQDRGKMHMYIENYRVFILLLINHLIIQIYIYEGSFRSLQLRSGIKSNMYWGNAHSTKQFL